MALVVFVIIGGIAGWLMGLYLKEHGYGLYADIAIGVLGGLIGGWLLGEIGIAGWWSIITAIIGAVVLVWVVRAVQRAASQQSPST